MSERNVCNEEGVNRTKQQRMYYPPASLLSYSESFLNIFLYWIAEMRESLQPKPPRRPPPKKGMSLRPFEKSYYRDITLHALHFDRKQHVDTPPLSQGGKMVSQLSSFGYPLPTCGCIYANAHFIHGF